MKKRKFRLFIKPESNELEVYHLSSNMDDVRIQMELFFLATHLLKKVSVIRRKLNYTKYIFTRFL